MANDVTGRFYVYARADKHAAIEGAMRSAFTILRNRKDVSAITKAFPIKKRSLYKLEWRNELASIEEQGLYKLERRTEVTSIDSELAFQSAWGIDANFQNRLCAHFNTLDEKCVVTAMFREEFAQEVGARAVTVEDGELLEFSSCRDLSGKHNKLLSKIDRMAEREDYQGEDAARDELDSLLELAEETGEKKAMALLNKRCPDRKGLVLADWPSA